MTEEPIYETLTHEEATARLNAIWKIVSSRTWSTNDPGPMVDAIADIVKTICPTVPINRSYR